MVPVLGGLGESRARRHAAGAQLVYDDRLYSPHLRSNRVRDESTSCLLGFAFRLATLERSRDGEIPVAFVALDHRGELVLHHIATAATVAVWTRRQQPVLVRYAGGL